MVWLGFCLLCLIWGSTWLGIKIGLEDAPPFLSAGIRFIIASFLLIFVLFFQKKKWNGEKGFWIDTVILGVLCYYLPYATVYWSEQYLSSGLTAVLFTAHTFFVALFSIIFLTSERITRWTVIGLIIGIVGEIIVFWKNVSTVGECGSLAMAVCLSGTIFSALGLVYFKSVLHKYDRLLMVGSQICVAAVLLVLTGIIFEDWHSLVWSITTVGSIIYLAILGTVIAFLIYFWLISRIPLVTLSLVIMITPLVALFLGWLLLNEEVTLYTLFGTGVVITGIRITLITSSKNHY